MKTGSLLRRENDGAIFRVVDLGHWSTIQRMEGTETYRVKWVGADLYVGIRGPMFKLLPEAT